MNDNHKKGLYYNFCEPYRGDIYFFNYSEHVFFLSSPTASQFMLQPQQQISLEPQMISVYHWNRDFF